jgi:hypothetical protein
MPTSKSSNQGPGPDEGPAAITMYAELAGRLVAALEQLGVAVSPDMRQDDRRRSDGTPDPTRERTARDHDVLRGLLGRTDAPRPLRMRRVEFCPDSSRKTHTNGDNAIVIDDEVPSTAKYAIVESPVLGSDPVRDKIDIPDQPHPCLELTEITATMPISRIELFARNRRLVAFGPSAAPIA